MSDAPKFDSVVDPRKNELIKLGFAAREYPADGAMLRKCVMWRCINDVVPVCQANNRLWFYVNMYVFAKEGTNKTSVTCEYEIAGQIASGDWTELKVYGIAIADLISKLDGAEAKLVAAWQAVNAP